jgi:transposase
LDKLLPHKESLERHVKDRLGTLFQLDYELLLYDVTSTYFEGEAKGNDLAARGYSRDHRPDCKQVCIGLVVTSEGYPLGYEVFTGNRNDVTTLQEIVARMESRYGQMNRIWALDRGMVSEANITWLKERGSRYIVGTPKGQLRRFERQLAEGEWSEVRDGLEVKTCRGPDGHETFVLCRSEDRTAKERAMRERFEKRIEAGLEKIRAACEKRRHQTGAIERRVGRLLGQNTRAAALFDVQVIAGDDGHAQLEWSKRNDQTDWAVLSEGCYLLRSNVNDWSGEELWRAYIQLTHAEAAFRIQKDELRLRPVWHQSADRVQAHILVCFLAFVLRKTLEGWSNKAGLGNSIPTLLEEFARIQSTDVILPVRDGRNVRLRCIVRPDRAQSILLDHLGLILPDRLKIPKGIDKCSANFS